MFTFHNRETQDRTEFTFEQMEDTSYTGMTDRCQVISQSFAYKLWLESLQDGIVPQQAPEGQVSMHNFVYKPDVNDHLLDACCSTLTSGKTNIDENDGVQTWLLTPSYYVDYLLGKTITIMKFDNGNYLTYHRHEGAKFVFTQAPEVNPEAEVPNTAPLEDWEQELMAGVIETRLPYEQAHDEALDLNKELLDVELQAGFGERATQLDDTTRIRLLALLRNEKANGKKIRELEERNTELYVEAKETPLLTERMAMLATELTRTYEITNGQSFDGYYKSGVSNYTFEQWAGEIGLKVDTSEIRPAVNDDKVDEFRNEMAAIIANVANEEGWCPEYDRMAGMFGWPDREDLGLSPEKDFSVEGYVTLRIPVSTMVTATDGDEAISQVESYGFDNYEMHERVQEQIRYATVSQMQGWLQDTDWDEAEEMN